MLCIFINLKFIISSLGDLTMILNWFVCLFNDSSQSIGPKGLNFSQFNGGHPRVVMRKFSEDQSKILPVGYTSKFPGWAHNPMLL